MDNNCFISLTSLPKSCFHRAWKGTLGIIDGDVSSLSRSKVDPVLE